MTDPNNVDSIKNFIYNQGLQFVLKLHAPPEDIVEALRQLAVEIEGFMDDFAKEIDVNQAFKNIVEFNKDDDE